MIHYIDVDDMILHSGLPRWLLWLVKRFSAKKCRINMISTEYRGINSEGEMRIYFHDEKQWINEACRPIGK